VVKLESKENIVKGCLFLVKRFFVVTYFLLAAFFLWTWFVPWLFSFFMSYRYQHTELLRMRSPDGKIDAVLLNTGDFNGELYQVYLVPSGSTRFEGQSEKQQEILPTLEGFGTGLNRILMHWTTSDLLDLTYPSGCIDSFSNHWCSFDIDDCDRAIAIRLHAPDDDLPHLCESWSPNWPWRRRSQ
jgi:hypothetical protein